MKKSICLIIVLFFVIQACKKEEKLPPSYTITAKLDGITDGKVKLSRLNIIDNEAIIVDTTTIKDGKFTFTGQVETPYFHTIMVNNDKRKRIHFFLENSNINITGNYLKMDKASVTGSKEDSIFKLYPYEKIFEKKTGLEIVNKYKDKAFAAFVAFYQFQVNEYPLDSVGLIINSFEGDAKKSLYYKHLDTLYTAMKRVAVSNEAPNFTIPDTTGTKVSLTDFRGKYVLIDFWASWCAPCRAANPGLVKVYNQFKDKNFTIVGVSVDKNRQGWLNAIKDDNLAWTNLSNVAGWDAVSKEYGIKSIPQNVLVDPKGIIIAKNLDEEKLTEKLEELLSE